MSFSSGQWCRVEALMAHQFMRRSLRYIVDGSFTYEPGMLPEADNRVLLAPEEGDLAFEGDRPLIVELQVIMSTRLAK